ncbi:MAG: 2-succinyl-5-enolpyruvyl-6-hydroxy-3-cyclohexene-1-carboxylic-acid synthase [Chloroflexota bacterium]|nr:2-succinyl-5-enolpyruvyl-6-hydroxy-3-cyclohexene-1-carboxylic-acid synthase [Chloroflexota bacterium]
MATFVGACIDEFTRCGMRHACIAPGSRSTPLAMLFHCHPAISVWMHVDERSAAFFALGLAKQLGEPVALVCTSGTAAAELHAAVIEARYGRVPLIVLTADRPPELQEIGAPQTIAQHGIYGNHVKFSLTTALPEATNGALRSIRSITCRAVALSLDAPAGPVHLNFPFREPLVPEAVPRRDGDEAFSGRQDGEPYARVPLSRRHLDPIEMQQLARELRSVERGIIVCGPQDDEAFPDAVTALAFALDYPILADPLSQVRCGRHDRTLVVDAYDAFLRHESLDELNPEIVLRFGAMPTSKPLLQFLERYNPRQIVVDAAPEWRDPTLRASEMLWAEPAEFCGELTACLVRPFDTIRSGWAETWLRANRTTRQSIQQALAAFDEPFEGAVFTDLAATLPPGSTLFVGSSMPVRDLDTFFPGTDRAVRFLSNRGANGIDGVVSSALGASAAARGPVYLAIGDLSFYHDLNGLLAASRHSLDLTVLLLNNDGGGIFSFLPQAAHPEQFEPLFGTPTGLDFRLAVEMYGGRFERVASNAELRAALAVPAGGLHVIEMVTNRSRNVELHREIWGIVAGALAASFPCPGEGIEERGHSGPPLGELAPQRLSGISEVVMPEAVP